MAFHNGGRLGNDDATIPSCSENFDVIVWATGAIEEGGFLRARPASEEAGCFNSGGIHFAEHRN